MTFTQPPLSLYIHFPWCLKKCPYCDFNSHTLRGTLPAEDYVNQLLLDFSLSYSPRETRPFKSIFLGGGTPSLFSPKSLNYLLSEIKKRSCFDREIEITLEANPGTLEHHLFEGYLEAGINRLSVGVQSFQDDKLKRLGRIHNQAQAITAILSAKQAGFKNFNIDLMFGLPEQTLEDGISDIQNAIALDPSHISWYQLTLEPNTLFAYQPPLLPQEEIIDELYERGQSYLAQAGYSHYEISAYSKSGYNSKHNENYWLFGDYLGIGAGAHTKLTTLSPFVITRTAKLKNPRDYLQAERRFIDDEKIISQEELAFEFMLNALRLNQPIPLTLFEQRTALSKELLNKPLQIAQEKALIQINPTFIQLTELGKRFYNDCVSLFLREMP